MLINVLIFLPLSLQVLSTVELELELEEFMIMYITSLERVAVVENTQNRVQSMIILELSTELAPLMIAHCNLIKVCFPKHSHLLQSLCFAMEIAIIC